MKKIWAILIREILDQIEDCWILKRQKKKVHLSDQHHQLNNHMVLMMMKKVKRQQKKNLNQIIHMVLQNLLMKLQLDRQNLNLTNVIILSELMVIVIILDLQKIIKYVQMVLLIRRIPKNQQKDRNQIYLKDILQSMMLIMIHLIQKAQRKIF